MTIQQKMALTEGKVEKSRLRASYLTTIISISLVLFVLGLEGLLLLHAKQLSDFVKENIGFSVYIKDDAKEVDIAQVRKLLDAEAFVKSTEYITKEEAGKMMQEDLGEDFISFLGYNPLLPSIDVKINAAYAHPDSLKYISENLSHNPIVHEVDYQENLVAVVNSNLKKIGVIILVFGGLLLVISIVLINNTIRLAIFSKRFLIKTMQLVGAKHSFITAPFVMKGITNGIVSAFIALLMLTGVLYYAQQEMPDLMKFRQPELYGALLLMVVSLGILISWFSTHIAVRKYLKLSSEDLY